MTVGLAGKRVVDTRAAHQSEALDALLRARGAQPVDYPCIAIAPPRDPAPLDVALLAASRGAYDWLLLTSANTVYALAQRLAASGLTLAGAPLRVAAVGPATAREAHVLLGLNSDTIPESYSAESLARALPLEPNARVLLPESIIARPTLAELLTARGARVDIVTGYETTCARGGADVPRLVAQRQIDTITFTSSSTVTCFLERFAEESGETGNLHDICLACIGGKTAETARTHGLTVAVVPAHSTLEGLVNALEDHYACSHAISE